MDNEILKVRAAKQEMIAIERKISDHNLVLLDLR
jgi:hypothetical protein